MSHVIRIETRAYGTGYYHDDIKSNLSVHVVYINKLKPEIWTNDMKFMNAYFIFLLYFILLIYQFILCIIVKLQQKHRKTTGVHWLIGLLTRKKTLYVLDWIV